MDVPGTIVPGFQRMDPMSSLSNVAELPITDRRELVEYLASGSRPRDGLAHRHRAREVRLPHRRSAPAHLRWRARHRSAARRPGAFRLGAGQGTRAHDRARPATARASRSNPPASSNSPAASSKPSTTRVARPTRTWPKSKRSRANSGSASSAWASSPSGAATKCRGCRRAATRSCATTCPSAAISAWT